MPCEHYKDALIEAAASAAALSGELRSHLVSCVSCHNTFVEEQSLFAVIDSGLHAAANAEVPPSLLPRVRASLDEAAAPGLRWRQPLVFVSVSAGLAFVIFLIARPQRTTSENVAKQGPLVSTPAMPRAKMNPREISPESTQIASVHASHSHAARSSTASHSAASSNPEVLVPPDERVAFARFLNRDQALASAASFNGAWAPKAPQESVEILPVEIANLTVTPLNKDEDDGQQTEF